MLSGCKSDGSDDGITKGPVSEFAPGEILTQEFEVDGQTVVSIDSEFVNLGTKDAPALFSIHKTTNKMTEGYEEVFFPLYRDKLEQFIARWKLLFVSSIGEDSGYGDRAYQHLLSFVLNNNIDPGLLIRVVEEQPGSEAEVVRVLQEATYASTRAPDKAPAANDILLWLYQNKVPVSALYSGQTRGTVGNLISIIKSIEAIADMWTEFAANNGPVVDMESNYISYLNVGDTDPSHYTRGEYFRSKTYSLKYKVSGIWYASTKYYVETEYGSKHATIPGEYIAKCNVISTEAKAGGPKFSVTGKVSYSEPINVGSFDAPAAEMNGKVSVDYGDCCCCHFFSYLNFKISAKTGYREVSFSSGRNH